MRNAHLWLGLLLATGMTGLLRAEDVVVANPSVPAATLSDDQFKDVFLGKRTTWSDGSKVVVVVLKTGSAHDELMQRLGRTTSQFQSGWKKLVFTGRAAMPEQVDSEAQLIELVAHTPGAIGLAGKDQLKDGVKTIAVQ